MAYGQGMGGGFDSSGIGGLGAGAFGGGFLGNTYNTVDKFTKEKEKEISKGILGKVAGAFLGPGWVGLETLSTLAKHTPNAIRNYTNFTPQSVPENLTGQKTLGQDPVLPGAYLDYDVDAFEHYNGPLQDMIDAILEATQPTEEPEIELHGKPLGMKSVDTDVLGLDEAMVRNYDGNPWDDNRSVISNISHSDTQREYAERALYSQMANQITQAANAPAPVRHDPVADLVRTVLSPKINQIKPETVKAIKRGKKPDYTMMSNYQQDLVRNILNPPKPPVSSNYSSIANR